MSEESPPTGIELHYVKSNGFRVVHADGVWGGPTPRGYITMSFYSERLPIPRSMTHELKPPEPNSPDRILGQEIARDSKKGIVREVEVEIMVDLVMAKSLIGWLKEKVQTLEGQEKGKAG